MPFYEQLALIFFLSVCEHSKYVYNSIYRGDSRYLLTFWYINEGIGIMGIRQRYCIKLPFISLSSWPCVFLNKFILPSDWKCSLARNWALKPAARINFHSNEKSITYGIVSAFCASLPEPDLDILLYSRWTGRGWRKEGAIMSQSVTRQKTCHYVKIGRENEKKTVVNNQYLWIPLQNSPFGQWALSSSIHVPLWYFSALHVTHQRSSAPFLPFSCGFIGCCPPQDVSVFLVK